MVEFEYYCDEFGGCIIDDLADFERFCDKACRFVCYITCKEPDFDSDDVKCCVCAIADVYAQNRGFLDNSSDDYSTESGISDELMHTAKLYLPEQMLYEGL